MSTDGAGGPQKPLGPRQFDLSDDSLEDWIGVDTDKESQARAEKFPEDLKNAFGFRKVSTIPREDIEKKLPEYKGTYPERQEKTGLASIRKFGRAVSRTQNNQTIFPKNIKAPVTDFYPSLMPETSPQDMPVHVFVSDDELVASMNIKGPVYTRPDPRPIFSGEPSPVDVQQTDQRSTCYMMSMLAAYAASPNGKRILEAMIRPAGEDLALVSFYDPLIRENIQVMVSTSRLVDKSGNDLYSFGNPTEARWAGILEKAYHAYKLSRSQRMKEEIAKAENNGENDRAAYYVDQLHKIAPVDPSRSILDWGDVLQSVSCLPELPEIEGRRQAEYRYQANAPKKLYEFDLKGEAALEELRYNVELGIPVTLGTPSKNVRGLFRALTTGTPTDHAIAVLGPAEMMSHGLPIQGVLVYDQYGSSLDGGAEINAGTAIVSPKKIKKTPSEPLPSESPGTEQSSFEMTSFTGPEELIKPSQPDEPELITGEDINTVLTKAAGRSVRFYSYDQLHKYFDKGAIARGGYN